VTAGTRTVGLGVEKPAAVAKPAEGRKGAGRRLTRVRSDGLMAALTWIGPSYLVFLAIMAFPAVWNIVISFFTVSYGSDKFVGFSNYGQILGSGQFYSSLWLTIYWTASVFVGQFLLGLLLALFFNRQLWVGKFLKPLMIIPWAVPGIVAATAWTFLYSQDGLIDQVTKTLFGIAPAWLSSPTLAMPAVIIAGIWKGAPFYFLMILAGLQSIPRELVEAAQVDGANRLRVLVSVEMPYIKNVLVVTSVLGLIWTANYFDGIYLMTQGGPINATLTLPIWIYNTAFSDFNLSEASALSVILLLIVLVLSIPAIRERRLT
jgi:multiple sugar transport system permease protein